MTLDAPIVRPVLTRVADVAPVSVEWLWPDRLAVGKVNLLVGDPGLGKSFVTLDIAARVSRGEPWPDRPHEPTETGSVILLSAEDDIADTIRPRLDRAGADVSRIIALEGIEHPTEHNGRRVRAFSLDHDLPQLENALEATPDARLVVIDPITAFLGNTDSHVNAEVRGILKPLSELAARHRVAVVAVSHLNKSGAGRAIYRSTGSLAFVAAARTAWLVAAAKEDPARRLLLQMKNNLAPNAGGLAYSIVNGAVAWKLGRVDVSADDAIAPEDQQGDRGSLNDAVDFLRSELCGGRRATNALLQRGHDAGFSQRTLERAKKQIGVRARRAGYGSEGAWIWELEPPKR